MKDKLKAVTMYMCGLSIFCVALSGPALIFYLLILGVLQAFGIVIAGSWVSWIPDGGSPLGGIE